MSYSGIMNAANPALQNRNPAFAPIQSNAVQNPNPAWSLQTAAGQGAPLAPSGPQGSVAPGVSPPVDPNMMTMQMASQMANPTGSMAMPGGPQDGTGAFGASGFGMGQHTAGGMGAFGRMGPSANSSWNGAGASGSRGRL